MIIWHKIQYKISKGICYHGNVHFFVIRKGNYIVRDKQYKQSNCREKTAVQIVNWLGTIHNT